MGSKSRTILFQEVENEERGRAIYSQLSTKQIFKGGIFLKKNGIQVGIIQVDIKEALDVQNSWSTDSSALL
jgi:hypothetical protein